MTPKPSTPTQRTPLSSLTPAQITDLRASLKRRSTVGPNVHGAYITYVPADGAFVLVADGRAMALSRDLTALCACLIQDRAEPGYIKRVLDSAEPPDIASLDPAARLTANEARAAASARVRELAAQADAARASAIRRGLTNITTLSLDDLLG